MRDTTQSTVPPAAAARARAGRCLVPGCETPSAKRGLCDNHYQLFWRTRAKFRGKRRRRDYEDRLIADGLILPSRGVLDLNNPFLPQDGTEAEPPDDGAAETAAGTRTEPGDTRS